MTNYTGTPNVAYASIVARCGTSSVSNLAGASEVAYTSIVARCGNSAITHVYGSTVTPTGTWYSNPSSYIGSPIGAANVATGTWYSNPSSYIGNFTAGTTTTAYALWWAGCAKAWLGDVVFPLGAITVGQAQCPTASTGHVSSVSPGAITMWQSNCMPPLLYYRIWKLFTQPLTVIVDINQNVGS